MPEQRFETRTISGDICVGDTLTGEYRTLNVYIPGATPPACSDTREHLAAAIVHRLNANRSYLPELWSIDRKCFVYADGSPA